MDLAKQLGLPNENVSYSPDLALGLQSGDPSIALEVLRQAGVGLARPKLGVTLISKMNRSFDSQAMQNYYEVLETSLGKFAHDNCIQLIFFNQVTGPTPVEDDSIPTARMVERLQRSGIDAIHFNQCLPPGLKPMQVLYLVAAGHHNAVAGQQVSDFTFHGLVLVGWSKLLVSVALQPADGSHGKEEGFPSIAQILHGGRHEPPPGHHHGERGAIDPGA